METSIADFHTSFYIPEIKNIAFHLPHIRIIGTNQCGNTHREALKCRIKKQYVLCCRDYTERLVASFAHRIKSKYSGRNIYVSIEGFSLEHYSAPT